MFEYTQHPVTKAYEEGWERIWGKKKEVDYNDPELLRKIERTMEEPIPDINIGADWDEGRKYG